MQPWHWAMLAVLPLMLGRYRSRTWACLLASSVVAHMLPPLSVEWYIVTDAAAGAIVLQRPVGCAQRAIGAMFALMVLYSVGYLWAGNSAGADVYLDAHTILGWVQWGCLVAWGVHDSGKTLLDNIGPVRRVQTADERV